MLNNFSETFSEPAATAFSLRKLRNSYSGSAIKLRRSNDNATQDIGFDLHGFLDTLALKSFVGNNNGYVEIWYDQSGNFRNASMATPSDQPRIVNQGVIERLNQHPAINFIGTNRLSTSTGVFFANGVTMVAFAKGYGVNSGCLLSKTGPANNTPAPFTYTSNSEFKVGNNAASQTITLVPNSASQARADINRNVLDASVYAFKVPNSGVSKCYIDTTLIGFSASSSNVDIGAPMTIGNSNGIGFESNFRTTEIITIPSVVSDNSFGVMVGYMQDFYKSTREQRFTTNGNFIAPIGVSNCYAELWGAGSRYGAGGNYALTNTIALSTGSSYPVTVGTPTVTSPDYSLFVNGLYRAYNGNAITPNQTLPPSGIAQYYYGGSGFSTHQLCSGTWRYLLAGGEGAGRFQNGSSAQGLNNLYGNGNPGGDGGTILSPCGGTVTNAQVPGGGGASNIAVASNTAVPSFANLNSTSPGAGLVIVHYQCPGAGYIEPSHTVPYPSEGDSISSLLGDTGNNIVYSWEQSTDKINWTPATLSINNVSYIDPNWGPIMTSKYYRRKCNSCGENRYSNVVQIKVFNSNQGMIKGHISGKITSRDGVTGVPGDTIVIQKTKAVLGSPQSFKYYAVTNNDGIYDVPSIFFGDATNGDRTNVDFTITPLRQGHTFNYSQVTTTLSNSSFERIQNFIDSTVYGVSGTIYQSCIGCLNALDAVDSIAKNMDSVKMYKNGQLFMESKLTNGNHGQYSTTVINQGNYTINPSYKNHHFRPNSKTVNVTTDVYNVNFEDTTKFVISGKFTAGNNEFIGRALLEFKDVDSSGNFNFRKRKWTDDSTGNYSIALPPATYQVRVIEVISAFGNTSSLFVHPDTIKSFVNNRIPKDSLKCTIDTANAMLNIIYHRLPVLQFTGLTNTTCATSNPPVNGTIFKQNIKDSFYVEVFEGPPSLNYKIKTTNGTAFDSVQIYTSIEDDDANFPVTKLFTIDNNGISKVVLEPGVPNLVFPYKKILKARYKDAYGRVAMEIDQPVYVTGFKTDPLDFTTTSPEIPLLILHAPPGDQSISSWETSQTFETTIRLSAALTGFISNEFGVNVGADFSAGFGVELRTEITYDLNTKTKATFSTSLNSELKVSTTTTQSYSTGMSESGITGELADVYIGGAINFKYGKTHELKLGTCGFQTATKLMVSPNGFQTNYQYSGHQIKYSIIPGLQQLADANTGSEKQKYLNQINTWNQILENNKNALQRASTVSNMSIGCVGCGNSTSITSSSYQNYSLDFNLSIEKSIAQEIGAKVNGTGANFKSEIGFTLETGLGGGITVLNSTTTTTNYSDNDVLDQVTFDVLKDPVYNTPMFRTIAGKTSCPWEPNTLKRDKCQIYIPNPTVTVPAPGQSASFTLYLQNLSESAETRQYSLSFDNSSIPLNGNISVTISGFPPYVYNIPCSICPNASDQQVIVTITRNSSSQVYSYEGLKFILKDMCSSTTAEGVVNAYFTNPCLTTPMNVVSPQNNWISKTNNNNIIPVEFSGYASATTTYTVSVQYAQQNSTSWLTAMNIPSSSITDPYSTVVNWNTTAVPDGNYKLRIKLECSSGAISYSSTVSGTIDRTGPTRIGIPMPSDHNYAAGDEISINYNENISSSLLAADDISLTRGSSNINIPVTTSSYQNKLMIVPTTSLLQFNYDTFRLIVKNMRDEYGNKSSIADTSYFTVGTYQPILGLDSVQLYTVPSSMLESGSGTMDVHFITSTSVLNNRYINYSITGNAVYGTDYTISYDPPQTNLATFFNGTEGLIVMEANRDDIKLKIDPIHDSIWEDNDTIRVTLAYGSDYQIPEDSLSAIAVIKNDDISITSSKNPILCLSDSLFLTANGNSNSTYLWNTGATTKTIKVTIPGTYSVTVASPGVGTSTSLPFIVTGVSTLMNTPLISANGPTTFCAGDSVQLSLGNFNAYTWSTGATTQNIQATTSGIYTVTVTNAEGCQQTATKTIVVNPLPDATLVASGPTSFCMGGSVQLSVPSGNSYLWSTGATTSSITATDSVTYSVVITNSLGCSTNASQAIIVYPLPTPAITGPSVMCDGDTAILNLNLPNKRWASSVIGFSSQLDVTDHAANQIIGLPDVYPNIGHHPGAWASSTQNSSREYVVLGYRDATPINYIHIYQTFNPRAIDTVYVKNETTGNFQIVYASAASNAVNASPLLKINFPLTTFNVKEIRIALNNAAIANYNEIDAVAIGDNTRLPYWGYSWSPSDTTTANFPVHTGGTYTVTVTNSDGCTASATKTITLNSFTAPTITASGPTTFCSGGSVGLSTGNYSSYLWSTGATTQSITASSSGVYSVTVVSNGCTVQTTKTVIVNPLPSPVITPNGPTTFCPGGSVTLSVNNYSSYLWSTGATTPSITVSSGGTYTVTVTDVNGCTNTATAVVQVYNTIPSITANGPTTICAGSSVELNAGVFSSYLWSNGATTPSIVVNASGTYSVTVTQSSCIGSNTASKTVVVINPVVPSILANGPTSICNPSSNTTLSLSASPSIKALQFDGVDDYADLGTSIGNFSGDFTIEFWMKTATISNGAALISKRGSCGNEIFYEVRMLADGRLYFELNGDPFPLTTTSSVTNNLWHHVAITSELGLNKIYVDGLVEDSLTTFLTSFANNKNLKLGKGPCGAYAGQLEEIRFWDVARTPAEILAAKNTSVPSNSSNLQAYFKLDEGTGTTLFNAVNNNASGTLLNGPQWITPSNYSYTSYLWAPSGATQSTVIPNVSGSYRIIVTDAVGCTAISNDIPITVSNNPTPSIIVNGNSSICQGDSVLLDPGIFSSYLWNTGDTTRTIYAKNNSTYSVTVSNNGCTGNASQAIVVNPNPATSILVNGNSTFCSNNPTTTLSSTNAGSALQFDGVNDYVDLGSIGNFTGSFTIEFWMKTSTISNSGALLAKRGTCGFENLYNFRLTSTGNIYFEYIYSPQGSFQLNSTSSVTNGQWHHIAVTCSTGQQRLYIDGALQASSSLNRTGFNNTQNLKLGYGPCGGYAGELEELRLWSVVRTASEIQTSKNLSVPINSTGLVGYYKLNEGSGTTTKNAVTNLSSAILTNGPAWVYPSIAPIVDTGFVNYLWNPSTASTPTINPNTTGIYSVTVMDTNGCLATSSGVSITAHPTPVPTISLNGPGYLCGNDSLFLNATSGALNMDGVNDYVQDNSFAINPALGFTVEGWMKISSANLNTLASKAYFNIPAPFDIRSNGSAIHFFVGNASTYDFLIGPNGSISLNTWTHVACSYDPLNGNMLKIYVNGTLVASKVCSTSVATNPLALFRIGNRYDLAVPCHGSLDEVRIWNSARSQNEIQSAMNSSVPSNSPSLVGYYKFDEGGGNTAVNTVTNLASGTLINGPTRQIPSTSPLAGPTYTSYLWSPSNVTTPTAIAKVPNSYSVLVTDANGCTGSNSIVITSCNLTLNLTAIIQGYYTGSQSMTPAMFNQGASLNNTISDSITVELHNANAPFAVAFTYNGVIDINGHVQCIFPASAIGNSYYIVVKNRTVLETWSSNPLLMNATSNYNFSSSLGQSYGSNQIQVDTNVYALYSGDINQDGAIDVLDYLLQDIDVINGSSGYLNTDLNGDGAVDIFDYIILDPNIILGATFVTP